MNLLGESNFFTKKNYVLVEKYLEEKCTTVQWSAELRGV